MHRNAARSFTYPHYRGAERRFRRAIELLLPPIRRPHLLALAHHSLAVALMHQGRLESAEYHARTALVLRPDPESHLAAEDRILLAKLRAQRGENSAPPRRPADAKLVPVASRAMSAFPRRASEADV